MLNWIFDRMVYFAEIQDEVGPAGYYRDPSNIETYLADSVFLPYLNNERELNYSKSIYERFTSLNSAVFVMFSNDTMIFPKETAWFGDLQIDGSVTNVNSTQFY